MILTCLRLRVTGGLLLTLLLTLWMGQFIHAQGIIMSASGPVNRSMGGASTAAPIDALGALYWNPASISGMATSQTDFGLDLILATQHVNSSVGPFTGSTESEAGVVPVPNVGWVHKTQMPAITCGLGVHAIAGFKTNLPADPANPVLAPPPIGLGSISSEASFLQLAPVVSVGLNDQISVAIGPTITLGQFGVDPFVFDSANTNGRYPSGRATRYHWGGGVQLSSYYIVNPNVRCGVSLKSPTWMEKFEFYGNDAAGGPRVLTANLDLPLILSVGASYTDNDRWLIALDVRYLDYANTDGLGDAATFDATGRLSGLDWSSVFASALGTEYRVNERLALRGGYTFNQNPVSNTEAFFNLASPLIYQHMLSTGCSFSTSKSMALNIAYSYMFENTRTGPIFAPIVGALPGSSVSNSMDSHFISFGISVFQ